MKEGTFDECLRWKKEGTWRFKMDECRSRVDKWQYCPGEMAFSHVLLHI